MKRTALALLLAAAHALPATAGVVFELEMKDLDAPEPVSRDGRVTSDGRQLRMDRPSPTGSPELSVIFQAAQAEPSLVVVQHPERSYMELDEKAMEGVSSQVSAAMAQMEAQLAALPPEQRAMVESMMKQKMGGMPGATKEVKPRTVKATSERRTIGSWPARKYEVHQDGSKVRDLWVTPWSEVPAAREMKDVFVELAELGRRMQASLGQVGQSPMSNAFAEMDAVDGLPVLTVEYRGGRAVEETRVRSVESASPPASTFRVPDGYRRRSLPGGRGS